MELFPEKMMSPVLTLENIASKLTYFHEVLHLIHWQTTSYAEHQATGGLYEYVHEFKDGLMEKLMGYCGRRPTSYKIDAIVSRPASIVVEELKQFAVSLKSFAESNGYLDVCNLADELSGEASKTAYLLTLT